MKKKKITGHGGERPGAGRKEGFRLPPSQLKEATKVRRVPVGLLDEVDALIERYKKSK